MLRDETLAVDVELDVLAKRTESFSGSDLKRKAAVFTNFPSDLSHLILDLCVSAALDAIKENVELPWSIATETSTLPANPSPVLQTQEAEKAAEEGDPSPQTPITRVLKLRNFTKALKEITPSASEFLGSLADLRKWNDEFGEGRRERQKKMWGGRFGFTDKNDIRSTGRIRRA